jgi:hypothetical protein
MWLLGTERNTEWFWTGYEPRLLGKPKPFGMHELTSLEDVH